MNKDIEAVSDEKLIQMQQQDIKDASTHFIDSLLELYSFFMQSLQFLHDCRGEVLNQASYSLPTLIVLTKKNVHNITNNDRAGRLDIVFDC